MHPTKAMSDKKERHPQQPAKASTDDAFPTQKAGGNILSKQDPCADLKWRNDFDPMSNGARRIYLARKPMHHVGNATTEHYAKSITDRHNAAVDEAFKRGLKSRESRIPKSPYQSHET